MGKEVKSKNDRYHPAESGSKRKASKRTLKKDATCSYYKDSTRCRFCNTDFITFEKLHSHTCKPFKCSKCLEAFKHDYELSLHDREHMDTSEGLSNRNSLPSVETFTCNVCNYTCESRELLSQHKFTCRKKLIKCDTCRTIIKINSEDKNKYCKKCAFTVNSQDNDYFFRTSSESDDNLSRPSTSRVSGNQFHETTNVPSLQDKVMVPCVRLEQIDTSEISSVIQSEVRNDSTMVVCSETSETLNINQNDSNDNVKNKVNHSKQTTHLKRNNRKNILNSRKTSISKFKKNSYRESMNKSKCPNVNALTKKRLRKKIDSVKSRTSSNPHKNEVFKKGISATSAKFSKRSSHGKSLNVKNMKNDNQKSENNSVPIHTTDDYNIANIENIIHSLPDSQSGILLKSSNKVNSCYKCVRCFKPLKLSTGGQHFSTCKAKYKTSHAPLKDIIWLCLLCHSSYSEISALLKHRKNCDLLSFKNNMPRRDWINSLANKNYSETFQYHCATCNFKCTAKDNFDCHSCDAILKRKATLSCASVELGPIRKLDLEPLNKYPYYECNVCFLTFLEAYQCSLHIKDCHPGKDENGYTSYSVFLRNTNLTFFGKKVKEEQKTHAISKNSPSPDATDTMSNNSTNLVIDSSVPNSNSAESLETLTSNSLVTDNFSGSNTNDLNGSDENAPNTVDSLLKQSSLSECTCEAAPILPNDNKKPCFICRKKRVSKHLKEIMSNIPGSSFAQAKETNCAQNKNLPETDSEGSSQQSVANNPRLFPTPPSTPDSNSNSSPKTSNVVNKPNSSLCNPGPSRLVFDTTKNEPLQNGSSITNDVIDSTLFSCPPGPSGIVFTRPRTPLQNDSSASLKSSKLNETVSNKVDLTSVNEVGNNQTPNTPTPNMLENGAFLFSSLKKYVNARSRQARENQTSVPSSSTWDSLILNHLSDPNFRQIVLDNVGDESYLFDENVDIPSDLGNEIEETVKGPFTLHYLFNFDGQDSDFLAVIPSLKNLTISKYICRLCLNSVNRAEDICTHSEQRHNKKAGDIYINYFVINEENQDDLD